MNPESQEIQKVKKKKRGKIGKLFTVEKALIAFWLIGSI